MIRSLKIAEWSERDRRAWLDACRPAHRLTAGGRAAHLKAVTRDDLARRFGMFLNFLQRSNRFQPDKSALQAVQPGIVGEYVRELSGRVSSVTVHGYLYKLRRAAEILDPTLNLGWLREIELDLRDQAQPAPKGHRIVLSSRILEAAIRLMERAEVETHLTSLKRARMARDGLLIAFLALCPIRLKNLASLRIDKHLVRQETGWILILPESETKNCRLDQRLVPSMLTGWIDLFLSKYKPMFRPSGNAMWPSQLGGAMSYNGLGLLVVNTTRKELGKPIGAHLFRHCVPYTIAAIDGSQMDLASPLLHHTDPRTTEKYCHLGQSAESSKRFATLIFDMIDETDHKKAGNTVRPETTEKPLDRRSASP